MLGWLAIAGGGLAVVKGFMGSLSNTRPGPVGSPSRAARYAFDADFPGASPVMLTVLVTSTDGVTPLIYRNESFDSAGGASGHRDTPITAAAANVSCCVDTCAVPQPWSAHPSLLRAIDAPKAQGSSLRGATYGALAARTPGHPAAAGLARASRDEPGDQRSVHVSFTSFWDLGLHIDPEDDATERAVLALADRALAFAAEARLFNPDGTSTLLVASVRCGVSGGVGGLISRFVPTQTSFSPASLHFSGGTESPLVRE